MAMDEAYGGSGGSLTREAALDEDADGYGEPTRWSRSWSREEHPEALQRYVDKMVRQNKQLEDELALERRSLRQMEAALEREEQAIEEMQHELHELESEHCPVCHDMVAHEDIDRHMDACLHHLTVHVADEVQQMQMRREGRRLRRSLSPSAERSPSGSPILHEPRLAAAVGSESSESWLDLDGPDAGLAGEQGGGLLAVEEVENARVRSTRRALRSVGSGSRARTGRRAESPPDWHAQRRSTYTPQRESDSSQRSGEHSMRVRDERHRGSLVLSFADRPR